MDPRKDKAIDENIEDIVKCVVNEVWKDQFMLDSLANLMRNFVAELKATIDKNTQVIQDSQQALVSKDKKIEELECKLTEKYDDLEQYQRHQCIRIFGVKKEEHENTDDLVMDIASKIGIKLVPEDIDRTHHVDIMVHKKSEYRLQFHLLGKDLRTKIWQDNITFRESCRKLNQADHYWTYQLTDEQCECENDEEEEDEAMLPQHKLKHKILVAKYGKQKPQAEIEDVTEQIQSVTRPVHINSLSEAQDIAVQTPNWKTQEQRDNEVSNSEVQPPEHNLNISVHPVKEHEQIKKAQEIVPSHLSTRQNIKIQEPKSQQQLKRDFINEHQHSCTTGYHSDRSALTPSSRTPHFTKTSKKAYFEGKRSPFASFGWNDSHRDIGQKKTYNVYAPENEVYSPALLALKRRREAIEKYLTGEAEKKRLELNSSAMGAVNHSSIWMSEYQDKFSHGRKFVPDRFYNRPKSAPSCHRSCGWRYS